MDYSDNGTETLATVMLFIAFVFLVEGRIKDDPSFDAKEDVCGAQGFEIAD